MRCFSLCALLAATLATPFASADPLYTIKDITPDGYFASTAYDINSHGDVVGVARSGAGEAYFYYDHSEGTSTPFGIGTVVPRGSITGTGYREAAINDHGVVAGTARFVGGASQSRGFTYNGSTFTNLGTLPGATATNNRPSSDALDINGSGIATGTGTSGAGTINNEPDNLDVYVSTALPIVDIDGDITVATRGDRGRALNDAGLVVGENELGRATLFSGATETTLYATASKALDLNESNQVVVEDSAANSSFRYEPSTMTLTPIPQMGTGNRMFGKAINESGDVVGWGDRSPGLSGQGRGFVYLDADAATYILEDHTIFTGSDVEGLSDWGELGTAWGVNDSGWIVGRGNRRFVGNSFPNERAFLLIPFDGLAGDYNDDGTVDAQDYATWRENLGEAGSTLANVVDNGVVGAAHLATWRANYGATAAGSVLSGVATPEPASVLGVLVAVGVGVVRRR